MKWQKKPVVVDAHQFDGDPVKLQEWISDITGLPSHEHREVPMQFWQGEPELFDDSGNRIRAALPPYLLIFTLEGEMRANVHDFIIRGVKGEFYPCKPQIFFDTYWPIDDDGVVLDDEVMPQQPAHFPTQKDANSV